VTHEVRGPRSGGKAGGKAGGAVGDAPDALQPTAPPAPPARPLRIDILSLFPDMFRGPFEASVIARARAAGVIDMHVHDLRSWTHDRHRTADDYAYGGGGGMVLKAEPVFLAVEELLGIPPLSADAPGPVPSPVVLMSPQGRQFTHAVAMQLAAGDRLILVAGHYEGFDERVRRHLATDELSVGDFVLTGGELPAMMVADAVARLRPGVVGLETATETDSFAHGLLEHPHYTRPRVFRGWAVPEVLVSGHHGEVDRWRRQRSLRRTRERRPDLLGGADLSDADRRLLEEPAEDQPDGASHGGPERPPA
jgi:tRNA (guanine37-N1)-methyltransferase